ncbi:hypothetical protein [Clostridium tarantellae]|uniref:Uncharacterized protein n=1 Tax=Clostridium tarantellae TaxID=39493 RepID=A0A6I1MJK2_9CLOT|nr:hypothetical protein [Clostridium tarantellae]MPQ42332.1 hypothetical protein [Clostridium tarantellae]
MSCNGEIWAVDDSGISDIIGKIKRIELSIEEPKEQIGIYRVEHVMLFDGNDEELYDDQSIVDNLEYHSEDELVEVLANNYDVSKDIIDII